MASSYTLTYWDQSGNYYTVLGGTIYWGNGTSISKSVCTNKISASSNGSAVSTSKVSGKCSNLTCNTPTTTQQYLCAYYVNSQGSEAELMSWGYRLLTHTIEIGDCESGICLYSVDWPTDWFSDSNFCENIPFTSTDLTGNTILFPILSENEIPTSTVTYLTNWANNFHITQYKDDTPNQMRLHCTGISYTSTGKTLTKEYWPTICQYYDTNKMSGNLTVYMDFTNHSSSVVAWLQSIANVDYQSPGWYDISYIYLYQIFAVINAYSQYYIQFQHSGTGSGYISWKSNFKYHTKYLWNYWDI